VGLRVGLGCELRKKINVSDRVFGCYGKFMFRTVVSDSFVTELMIKVPLRGN